jgi:hypothetical protein
MRALLSAPLPTRRVTEESIFSSTPIGGEGRGKLTLSQPVSILKLGGGKLQQGRLRSEERQSLELRGKIKRDTYITYQYPPYVHIPAILALTHFACA